MLDPLSDHSGSLVKLGRCWHAAPAPQAWEFQKVAPLTPDFPAPSKADSIAAWSRVATPEDAWSDRMRGDIDACWLQWSRDAEAYLHEVGAIQHLELFPAGGNPDLKQGSPSMARDKVFLNASCVVLYGD